MMRRFEQAAGALSLRIRTALMKLPDDVKKNTWEIRLRAGLPVTLFGSDGSCFITETGRKALIADEKCILCTSDEINDTFTRLCGYSVHSHTKDISEGFITINGGHRAGLCGTAAEKGGNGFDSIRFLSSINLRIARENKTAAQRLFSELYSDGLKSIIIAGAPLSGKTTLLRDLARRISGGECGYYRKTVIADERGEIAAVYHGIPQNDIGINCDVLSGYSKQNAIQTAVRCLSPEIVICDEIGSIPQVKEIITGLNSGVKFALSIHADNAEQLGRKPQYRYLCQSGEFDYTVVLKNCGVPCTIDKIYKGNELIASHSSGSDIYYFDSERLFDAS